MWTIWKVLQSKLFLFIVLVAAVALMVPMAVALAGSDETTIAFSGERIFSGSPEVGDTLEFEVDNAGPGLSGLSGSGEFFDASESVTEQFVITDSFAGEIVDVVLKDGDGVTRIHIEFDAVSPDFPTNGMRVRYFGNPRTFKGVFDTRFSLFKLKLAVKAK